MLDLTTRERIDRERFRCLCTQYFHSAALERIGKRMAFVDGFALIVSALYFPMRLYVTHGAHPFPVRFAWQILATCLVVVTAFKLLSSWQERFENHGKALGATIMLEGEASDLLNDNAATVQHAEHFLSLVAKDDGPNLIPPSSTEERQHAYRQALKRWGGAYVVCPVCYASPWKFLKGSCKTCGNTPCNLY
jgi:mobilome CxxCx(11)CxxC protein